MYHYDPDFYRQCHEERVAAMRADYQRVQTRSQSKPKSFAHFMRYARSMFGRTRSPRRAPMFRA